MTNAEALRASRARRRQAIGDAEWRRQQAAERKFYYHKRRILKETK